MVEEGGRGADLQAYNILHYQSLQIPLQKKTVCFCCYPHRSSLQKQLIVLPKLGRGLARALLVALPASIKIQQMGSAQHHRS